MKRSLHSFIRELPWIKGMKDECKIHNIGCLRFTHFITAFRSSHSYELFTSLKRVVSPITVSLFAHNYKLSNSQLWVERNAIASFQTLSSDSFALSHKLSLYRESVCTGLNCIPYQYGLRGTVNLFRMIRGSLYQITNILRTSKRLTAGLHLTNYRPVFNKLQVGSWTITRR